MIYIYILRNKINNKLYIGQTNNLKKRAREHKAKDRLKTKKTHLYFAINKYGFNNFEMISIEEWDDPKEADESEEFWIQFFQTRNKGIGYNISEGGKVNRGFKHTEKFKINKSKQMKIYFQNNRPHNAKLSKNIISQIRDLFLTGNISYRKLSKQFNIDKKSIVNIVKNISYIDKNYTPNFDLIKNIANKNSRKRN